MLSNATIESKTADSFWFTRILFSTLSIHGSGEGIAPCNSLHTRLRRWHRPSGGADAPGAGYDLRWEDITLRGEILEGQNWSSWVFSGPGTPKKDSPEKMLSNGTHEKCYLVFGFFFMNFFGFWVKNGPPPPRSRNYLL